MTGIIVTRVDGRLHAIKSSTPEQSERRRAEADLLSRLDHPGVVELVDLVEGPPLELHTAFVGTESWEDHPPTSEGSIVEGLASVASTITDLHEFGIAHGSIRPEHVVVAADRRPVLCGLADACSASVESREADVRGLGHLIGHLSKQSRSGLQAPLTEIAHRCKAAQLSARELTDELNELRPSNPARPRAFAEIAMSPVAVGLGVLATLVVLGSMLITRQPASTAGSGNAGGDRDEFVAIREPYSMDQATSADTIPVRLEPATDTTETAADSAADPLVIVHDDRLYGLGDTDDIAIVGDWNCDGTETPALLDIDASMVAFFAFWPAIGQSQTADLVIAVEEATDLRLDPDSPCGVLRVVHSTGSTLLTPEFS